MRVECSFPSAPGFAQIALNFSFLRELIILGPSLTVLPVMRARNFACVVRVVSVSQAARGYNLGFVFQVHSEIAVQALILCPH